MNEKQGRIVKKEKYITKHYAYIQGQERIEKKIMTQERDCSRAK